MLRKLSVENYALIDSLELVPGDSLNIITGETGAGKSILLGALGLLLGNRADAGAIKDAARNCVVEGVFDVDSYGLEGFFAENDLEYDAQTVVRRVISPAGKSRSYVNDLPVQQAVLKGLGARLIDVHSQHQTLMLADDGFRTGLLDSVAGNKALREEYGGVYGEMRRAERELDTLRAEADRNGRDREWLEHQAEQLSGAALRDGEQEELEAEQSELSHAEDIKTAMYAVAVALDEDETGVLPLLKAAESAVSAIAGFYPQAEEYSERLRSSMIDLRDLECELSARAERLDSDPARLQIVTDRLDMIYGLQQKFRVSGVSELLELQAEYESRLAAITGSDEALAELEKKITRLHDEAGKIAARLSAARKKAADEVAVHVKNILGRLGMPAAEFIAEVAPSGELRAGGGDNIRFLFSANRNIAPAPVEKTASGGELSRLMLALKSIVARSANLPTIIFDEIDSGVSGPVADAMGAIIEELSQSMQVINITHLPQVAGKGDMHFVVYKEDGPQPRTRIAQLSAEERIEELAKMLSGSRVTDEARAQARHLLGK